MRQEGASPLFWLLPVAAVLAMAWPVAHAADPQAYTVTFSDTGNAALDQALKDSSTLVSLNQIAPVGPFALVSRAQKDLERFAVALDSFGFYKGKAEVRIGGRTLGDNGLYDFLAHAPANPPVPVSVTVERGPLFHLRRVEVNGDVPDRLGDSLGLKPGAPAQAADVLAARERLLETLRENGYALAKIDEPVAVLVAEADALDVSYRVETGPVTTLGEVSVQGLADVDESYVRRRLLVYYGDPFSPKALEKARQDLASTGVFASVRVRPAKALDAQGRLPVAFDVTERPKRAINVGAAYSTDLGGSLSTAWQHRNLFGKAEQLNLAVGVTQLGGNSTTGIGYKGSVGFVKPDFLERDQSLNINLAGIKQSLIAYDQKAILGDVTLSRKFANYWSGSVGLAGEQSEITQESQTTLTSQTNQYTLLSLPVALKYDSTNSLLDPTKGIRAAASLAPIKPLAGPLTDAFVVMQVSGSSYLDLFEPGRSVLALRGTVGDVEGASQSQLPPDKRFYAGGSTTVRGYKFQSIGPQSLLSQKPLGGTAMAAATAEFRQRILEDYGAVVFTDVGQVNTDGLPFTGTWRMGVGVGARYYTAFGPIRLDVALPVVKQDNGGSYEVYIGLGQAF
ncbi:MAG: autotransporter assembly complex protein TamA [Candidatus Methylumidiphilus sp.]